MSLIEIKQLLHSYIYSANEQDVEALLTFIEENRKASHNYSEIELNEFYKRKQDFLSNGKKGYSTEEVHGFIRQRRVRNYSKTDKRIALIILSRCFMLNKYIPKAFYNITLKTKNNPIDYNIE